MQDYQAIYRVSAELSRLLAKETSLNGILSMIGELSVAAIPTCEQAGVTREDHGKVLDRVVTDPQLERIDSYQYAINQGPCLYASSQGVQVLIEDMGTETRWPGFTKFAAAHGVASTYSIPMKEGDEVVGALNLYSYHEAFGPDDEKIGLLFAEEAAVAVRSATINAKSRELIENLNRALESRSQIGRAVGLLMLREGITAEAAFEALKAASQTANIKAS